MRKTANKIAAAHFRRIDAQLARRVFHQPFNDVTRFWSTCAAIGIHRCCVGVHGGYLGMNRGNVVLARQQGGVHVGGNQRTERGEIRAEICRGMRAQRQNGAVSIQRKTRLREVVAAMGIGEEGLAAACCPLHRSARALGRPAAHDFFGIQECFRTEAAAHVFGNHAHLVFRCEANQRRQHHANAVGILTAEITGQTAGACLEERVASAGLHRIGHEAVVDEIQRSDVRGVRKCSIRCGAIADLPIEHPIAGGHIVELRCVWF